MTTIQYLGLYRHYHLYYNDDPKDSRPYYGVNDDESYIPDAPTLDRLKQIIDRQVVA